MTSGIQLIAGKPPSSRSCVRRRALTLIELVSSMAVMSILLAGITSAMVIAGRALDDGTSPATITADAADVLADITAELDFALQFKELAATAITFTVPDRDGDTKPETIRYAWSGTPGDPLTRAYNGGTAVNVIDAVDKLAFSHLKRTLTPPPQACCNAGTCTDEPMDSCAAGGGEAMGPETDCTTVTCPTDRKLLFVTAGSDVAILSAQESARIALLESWGFAVTYVAATDTQENFDVATAAATVAYVNAEINDMDLGTKLSATSIGVVNENEGAMKDFGLGTLTGTGIGSFHIAASDEYITKPFAAGLLTIFSTDQEVTVIRGGTEPPGGLRLGWSDPILIYNPSLITVETGALLTGGSPAPGRRVKLPWGSAAFNVSALNADGLTIMERTVEWAAGLEGAAGGTVCGNATCEVGEDGCTCETDCGPPPAFELPGVTCADGLDNDCDGLLDCNDNNCFADPACTCGNGACDPGEDCVSCSADCSSVTGGKPSNQYCCGNGVLEAAEGDGTICDGNP